MTTMRFFSDETISARQRLTPEGFLVCADAVLARTGTQIYHVTELPDLQPDADGWIAVERPEAEVFAPRAIASFEGKPITVEHPDDVVHPGNWKAVSVGHVAHVRRGAAPDDDVLLGDLLITDDRAIQLVRHGGWRSLSCGYDAAYSQSMPGRATQRGIVGNHLALLPDGQARCGPRCVIGDSASNRRGKTMGKRKVTRDQEGNSDIPTTWAASLHDPNDGRRMDMGADPEGEVGGELVMTLPGERTAYYISALPDGSGVGLYRHVSASGSLQGGTTTADRPAMAREMRARAKASEPQQFAVLATVNKRNAEFWGRA